MADWVSELQARGLVHQTTDEAGLRQLLATPQRIYAGLDPTADSLTIGNLVALQLLVHAQRAGHTPVIVMGGGTGLIGDPSGKSSERELLSRDDVARNVAGQRRIYERLFAFEGANAARLVDNLEWLGDLTFIDVLRDVGKHFSVANMLQKDSVRDRLHNRAQGLSYTEFAYVVLQAYDFYHLARTQDVRVQVGGSDQWGNIVSGVDLIRRLLQREAYGLTTPLVTKADGGKFGKTEKGAVWLTADRTSPYAFYQFWLNTADADVARFLRVFTLLPTDEIGALVTAHEADPGRREAHRVLARHMTVRLHGDAAATQAEVAAQALFTGDVSRLDLATIEEVFAEVPATTHDRGTLGGAGVPLADLLPLTSLATSKRQAREFLATGSITVNGRRVESDASVRADDLLHGRVVLLRRGKKTWHATRWE